MDLKTAWKYLIITSCIVLCIYINLRHVKNVRQTHLFPLDQNQDLEMHDIKEFYKYIATPRKACIHSRGFGGHQVNVKLKSSQISIVDGDRVVCLDKVFDIKPGNCIVYSFGINNDFSFDDAMTGFGCQVFSFDPTMRQKSHIRSEKIHFYNIGISNKDGMVKIGSIPCNVMRITSIMKLLGHGDDVIIDFLKLDVEGAEIQFLEDVLQNSSHVLKRIKQIGMEIHPKDYSKSKMSIFQKYYKLMKLLERHGFKLFSSKENPWPSNLYFLHELGRKVPLFMDMVWGRWPDSN